MYLTACENRVDSRQTVIRADYLESLLPRKQFIKPKASIN